MKTIIVATDFSSTALNAAVYALKMAKIIDANILLFNVYEVLPNYGEMILDVDVDGLKKSAEQQLVKFKVELLGQTNELLNITTEVRLGIFKDELIAISERINPYAVLMGSQGKTTAEHFLMGSHAGKTINHFAWPIITIPPDITFSAIKKIGIAYDFEIAIDEGLIADIKVLAQDFNAAIEILNVAHEDEFDENFIFLSHTLDDAFKPFIVKYHFLASHKTDESILNFVEKNDFNLLIVMPKHHNLFQKLFEKNHTKQLVLHCHIPVMSLSK